MSSNFDWMKKIGNERIEIDASNNALKKFNGTCTSWFTHIIAKPIYKSHKDQKKTLFIELIKVSVTC